MKHLRSYLFLTLLRANLLLLVLIVIIGFLAVVNYAPHAFLMGWDNLQSDLSPVLGIKRAIFSSWQEFQSFGLPAGMGHAADLVHAVMIWLLSLLMPLSVIRYVYQWLMVLAGAVGFYVLILEAATGRHKTGLAFLGGLSYILNFMCIQLMFLPVEPFSVLLGMLPWQIWGFLKLLDKRAPNTQDWGIFILINLLATPQAVAQQLFVVVLLLFALMGFGRWIQERFSLSILRRGILAFVVIVVINSFWILPQVYFLATNRSTVENAKINQLSTEDIYYRNKDKGDLTDFLTFTGFFYDGYDKNQQFLFKSWKEHRQSVGIEALIYIFAGIMLLGMFRKSKYQLPFILCYLLVAFSLLLNTWPFNFFNDLLRQNALFNQIFRSPFTKFAIPYGLIATYLFVFGVEMLIALLGKIFKSEHKKVTINYGLILLMSGLVIAISYPAFRGEYFSSEMKVKLPEAYRQVFAYFSKEDKNKRIALLPEYTHWGWLYTTWGYDGSGFLWYGIEQPIISRNFDYWDNHSESYYWELKRALEREDLSSFEKVLEKYGIDYILYDHTIAPIVTSSKALQYERLNQMLKESRKITLAKNFGEVSIYAVAQDKKVKSFAWQAQNLPNIGPMVKITDNDLAFKIYGHYLSDPQSDYEAYFPYLDVMSQSKRKDQVWSITEEGGDFKLQAPTGFTTSDYKLSSPSASSDSALYTKKTAANFVIPYQTELSDKQINFVWPKIAVDEYQLKDAQLAPCTSQHGNLFSQNLGNGFSVESNSGGYGCFHFTDPNLEQRNGYLLKVVNHNTAGQRLFFYVLDRTKDQTYLEDRFTKDTEYYVLGSKYQQGVGYTFAFQINSYPEVPSKNELNSFAVYLMPYDLLKQLALIKNGFNGSDANFLAAPVIHKDNYYRYHGEVNTGTLVLNQAYQAGWKAYLLPEGASWLKRSWPQFFLKPLKHIIVDNWANGWDVPRGGQIVIVYEPQYLEYVGFFGIVILGTVYLGVVWRKKK